MMIATGRKCTVCGVYKPFSEYYKSERAACKDCKKARAKRVRQSEKGKEYIRQYSKLRYQKYRDKGIARAKVAAALKAGKLTKPQHCEDCLGLATVYGHHTDYRKPLEVVWLCLSCHIARHGRTAELIMTNPKNRSQR